MQPAKVSSNSEAVSRVRGGLFHASLSDPAVADRKVAILRSIFNTIDSNANGVIDRDELVVYVRWASSAEVSDAMHKRMCTLFLEDDSLDKSFTRFD